MNRNTRNSDYIRLQQERGKRGVSTICIRIIKDPIKPIWEKPHLIGIRTKN